MSKAVYPGTFDPPTSGHLNIIKRASEAFDYLTVTILENPRREVLFTWEERLEMLKKLTAPYTNVEIDYSNELLIDYANRRDIHIVIKGLRAMSDFEFEFQMALVNRRLDSRIETMFIMTDSKYSYLTSGIVKEIASFGGDIRQLVPPSIYEMVISKFSSKA